MSKLGRTVGLCLLAFALLIFGSHTYVQAQAADKASLRLSWLIVANFAPFFMGVDKGFYKSEGIDLTIHEGKGSSLAAQMVAQKKNTFGVSDAGVMIKSIENGLPIKMVWCHTQTNPMSVLSSAAKGIRAPKDLVGKKIAGSARSSMTLLFRPMLKRNNIDTSKVEVFNSSPPFHPLVLSGKVDAMLGYWPDNVPKFEEFGLKVNVVKYADWGLNTLSNGLTAHLDTIAKQPDLVRRFVRASARSWEYAQTHIQEAIDSQMSRMAKGKRSTQVQTLKNTMQGLYTKNSKGKPLGWMSPKDWKETVDTLHGTGLIKTRSPIDRYYTNQFVPSS